MPQTIEIEAPQPASSAVDSNDTQGSPPASCSVDSPSSKKRKLDTQEDKATTPSPWYTEEQLSNLSLAQAYELIGGKIDDNLEKMFGHIPSGENRTRHVYAYLMKQVKQKITKGEISQDVFQSVTTPQIIEESTMTEKVTISEDSKISSEASNSLPKSVSTPAAAKQTDTNPRFKKAKFRKEASNSAKILKVTSNSLPKSASIPAATEAATNPRSDDALHDVPATFGHNKEKNEQDDTDRGGIEGEDTPSRLTIEECIQRLSDEIESQGKVPDSMLTFLYNAIKALPKEEDESGIFKPTTLYRLKSTTIRFTRKQRRLKENAKPKTRNYYITRLSQSIVRQIQSALGNAAEEIGPQVANRVALEFGLNIWQSAALTFAELHTIKLTHKLSVNMLSKILQSIVNLRPEWKGKVFPTLIKKGLLKEMKKNENTTTTEESNHVEHLQAEQEDSPHAEHDDSSLVQNEQEKWPQYNSRST